MQASAQRPTTPPRRTKVDEAWQTLVPPPGYWGTRAPPLEWRGAGGPAQDYTLADEVAVRKKLQERIRLLKNGAKGAPQAGSRSDMTEEEHKQQEDLVANAKQKSRMVALEKRLDVRQKSRGNPTAKEKKARTVREDIGRI